MNDCKGPKPKSTRTRKPEKLKPVRVLVDELILDEEEGLVLRSLIREGKGSPRSLNPGDELEIQITVHRKGE